MERALVKKRDRQLLTTVHAGVFRTVPTQCSRCGAEWTGAHMLICPDPMVRREFALLSAQAATLLSHLSVIFGGDKRPASASSVRDRVRACLGHMPRRAFHAPGRNRTKRRPNIISVRLLGDWRSALGDGFLHTGRRDHQKDHGPSWPEDVQLTDLRGGRVDEG